MLKTRDIRKGEKKFRVRKDKKKEKESDVYIHKRYVIIDKQLAQHYMRYSECLSNPLPFYATHIIDPFLNSRISASHDK